MRESPERLPQCLVNDFAGVVAVSGPHLDKLSGASVLTLRTIPIVRIFDSMFLHDSNHDFPIPQ